jgi:hypothetical protein
MDDGLEVLMPGIEIALSSCQGSCIHSSPEGPLCPLRLPQNRSLSMVLWRRT